MSDISDMRDELEKPNADLHDWACEYGNELLDRLEEVEAKLAAVAKIEAWCEIGWLDHHRLMTADEIEAHRPCESFARMRVGELIREAIK